MAGAISFPVAIASGGSLPARADPTVRPMVGMTDETGKDCPHVAAGASAMHRPAIIAFISSSVAFMLTPELTV